MSLRSSPVPRTPGAADGSDLTTLSVLRKNEANYVVNAHAVSELDTPFPEVQSQDTFAPSDVIVPFNFDISTPLVSPESGQAAEKTGTQARFRGEDIMRLQRDLIVYVEELNTSLRSLFMHENENMVEMLRRTKDMSVTHLFFQTQKEMRQLIGEDSSAKDRECIQRLSELLEE